MFRKKVRQYVLKKKPSLSTLLHETLKRQWDEIRNAMKKFTYFDDWNETAFHQCCVHSNILYYAVNEIIYVKDDANVEVTHFILEGTVLIIQKMILEKYFSKRNNKWKSRLYKDQSATVSANDPKLELVFMQICKLDAGACFGLGEKLSKNIIIGETELKCLVVPKSIVLRNKTVYNVWERIIITMDMNTPTLKQVFQEYRNARRRLIWERKLYKSRQYGIYYDRIPVNITLHDTPLSLRSSSILYANKFKAARNDPMYLIGEKKEANFTKPEMPDLKDYCS